ncbi:MAG: helix-turn-helix domain-containing protein [Magnetococcales bacterium]|nr:helix-turn-helix domain-containing protein [Magnetococcales bacterium]
MSTSTEFNILELLMKEAGRVVNKETLALHGLGRKVAPYDRSIDLHISMLRRKLGHGQSTLSPIRTIRGSGYFFALSDEK